MARGVVDTEADDYPISKKETDSKLRLGAYGGSGAVKGTDHRYNETQSYYGSIPILFGIVAQKASFRLLYILIIVLAFAVILLLAGFITALVFAVSDDSDGDDLPSWPSPSDSPLGSYSKAAVSSNHGRCSEIGRDIMIKGGNAVDAVIAVDICIGVMDPHSSGIGGGHFMTIYNALASFTSKKCIIIDARETAAAASDENMFVHNTNESTTGYKAVAIPGNIHGLYTAYEKYGSGKVTWTDLIQPTTDMLKVGIPVSQALAKALLSNEAYPFVMEKGSSLNVFMDPKTGQPYKESDIIHLPELYHTLDSIAINSNPIYFFYRTLAAQYMPEFTAGGIATLADFKNYSSIVREEDAVMYTELGENLVMCGPPPPSSAAVAMSLLKIMAGYRIETDEELKTLNGNVELYQRFIEAMKFVYGDRSYLGDMAFVHDALSRARNITTAKYAAWIRSMIRPNSQPFDYYNADFAAVPEDHGTSQHNTLDSEGNAVSMTCTINTYFGSKMRSPSTGIIWNNEMDDFSTPNHTNSFGYPPSKQNFIHPGKKPMSSMSPIVIFNNKTCAVKLVIGGAGGSRIISGTGYVAMRALWMNETIKEALDAPRMHNQLAPFYTRVEHGFPKVYVDGLSAKGQDMRDWGAINEMDAIQVGSPNKNNRTIFAACDWRKGDDVYPAGF